MNRAPFTMIRHDGDVIVFPMPSTDGGPLECSDCKVKDHEIEFAHDVAQTFYMLMLIGWIVAVVEGIVLLARL